MKNNFYFFLGLFGALGISWAGIVLASNYQLGPLPPYYDDNSGNTYPEWMPGVAAQGQVVYKDLGCVACHTQQVRRPGFGSDQGRKWGDRQSVARDYIYQPSPQLGLSRVGPDLTNLGGRTPSAPDADDLLNMLYSGSNGMPSYRFLFEERQIGPGAQPSENALKLVGNLKPRTGWEIVPTRRAESLVGYLLSLKTAFTYPEATPVPAAKSEGEPPAVPAPNAAPAPVAATPVAPANPASPSPTAAPVPKPDESPTAAPSSSPTPSPALATPQAPSAAEAAGTPTPAPSAVPTPSGSPSPTPTANPPAATPGGTP